MAKTTLVGITSQITGLTQTDIVTLPGGASPDDGCLCVIFRNMVPFIIGTASLGEGWGIFSNFGGNNTQFNVFTGVAGSITSPATVTYAQSGNNVAGLLVVLRYQWANGLFNLGTPNGGVNSQPNAGAEPAGQATADSLVLLGTNSSLVNTIIASVGSIYGHDFQGNAIAPDPLHPNAAGLAIARAGYDPAGGNPSFTGTPNPAGDWAMANMLIFQQAGAPTDVPPFSP